MNAAAAALQARLTLERRDIALSTAAPHLFSGLTRADLCAAGEDVCRTVEAADILVVGSPVYRASYTGILKHLFDLVDRDAMAGRKALLVATGGTPLHGLVLEHQFRPLMGFFGVQTIATSLFGLEGDFEDRRIVGGALLERVERAADEAAALMRGVPWACDRLAVAGREWR